MASGSEGALSVTAGVGGASVAVGVGGVVAVGAGDSCRNVARVGEALPLQLATRHAPSAALVKASTTVSLTFTEALAIQAATVAHNRSVRDRRNGHRAGHLQTANAGDRASPSGNRPRIGRSGSGGPNPHRSGAQD